MKTILVATDLSGRSDRAMKRAASLADAHGARLIVVAVIDEDLPKSMADAQAEQARAALLSEYGDRKAASAIETRVVIGDPHRDIHAIAAETDADLIVLGLHRSRPFLDLFRETTMERLVRMSERPVLIVRDLGAGLYSRILVPIDFSPASEAALRAAANLCPNAKLTLFNSYHVPFKGLRGGELSSSESDAFLRDVQSERRRWLKDAALPDSLPEIELIDGSIRQVLDQKIAVGKPDLIAIGAHGRASLAPGIVGSLTRDLKRNPPCDMLIARRRAP